MNGMPLETHTSDSTCQYRRGGKHLKKRKKLKQKIHNPTHLMRITISGLGFCGPAGIHSIRHLRRYPWEERCHSPCHSSKSAWRELHAQQPFNFLATQQVQDIDSEQWYFLSYGVSVQSRRRRNLELLFDEKIMTYPYFLYTGYIVSINEASNHPANSWNQRLHPWPQ